MKYILESEQNKTNKIKIWDAYLIYNLDLIMALQIMNYF